MHAKECQYAYLFIVAWMAGFVLIFALASATMAGLAQSDPALAATTDATRLGTAFSDQGRLLQEGAPVTALCDFEFTLWGAATGGGQQGSKQSAAGVSVAQGLFTVDSLDFGDRRFQGESRWLEIGVRCPTASGSFTPLSPRQALLATPYALSLRPGADIVGNVLDSGADTAVLTASNTYDAFAPDGAYGLLGSTLSPTGAGVKGTSTAGAGGHFSSGAGFALVAPEPSIIGARTPNRSACCAGTMPIAWPPASPSEVHLTISPSTATTCG